MSVYSPSGFGYLPQAEAYFLGLTQVGVMLSARDLDLLRKWREAGIPIEVVCRGLRAAFDAFETPPRSIWNSRRYVAVEIDSWRARVAGGHEDEAAPQPAGPRLRSLRDPTRRDEALPADPPAVQMPAVWNRSLEALVAAGKQATDPRIKEAYRRAWRVMQELAEEVDLPAVALAIGEVEAEFFDEVLATLTDAERHALDSELSPRLVAALRAMSPDARAAQLRVWRRPALSRLGAVSFFDP